MSDEPLARLRGLQVATIVLVLASAGFLGWDRWKRRATAPPADLAATLEAHERKIAALEQRLAEAAQDEHAAAGRADELARAIEALRKAAGPVRVVPIDRRFVVQFRRERRGGFGARRFELPSSAKDAFTEAAALLAAAPVPELAPLAGADATVPLEKLDLGAEAGGPFGEGLLFVSAIVRANNDAGELAARPNRLWLQCADRGEPAIFDLAGPFFLAAKRTEEDSLGKSTANLAVFRAGPRARLALGIDAEAQRLTADGQLDVAVRVGPLLVVTRDE
jgi:hypothetical protein